MTTENNAYACIKCGQDTKEIVRVKVDGARTCMNCLQGWLRFKVKLTVITGLLLYSAHRIVPVLGMYYLADGLIDKAFKGIFPWNFVVNRVTWLLVVRLVSGFFIENSDGKYTEMVFPHNLRSFIRLIRRRLFGRNVEKLTIITFPEEDREDDIEVREGMPKNAPDSPKRVLPPEPTENTPQTESTQ